ncbi:MAG: hypothetical protein HQ592_06695 [Planctomycetes bacterium]|nr:hypothetical protein [Planctomycetota bacterium]
MPASKTASKSSVKPEAFSSQYLLFIREHQKPCQCIAHIYELSGLLEQFGITSDLLPRCADGCPGGVELAGMLSRYRMASP